MMPLHKLRMIALLIMLAFIAILFLLNVLSFICPVDLIAKSVGIPTVTVRNNDFLCSGISQIVSDKENVYLLFAQHSVVQVYAHDGTYRYSISVYNHPNGRTEIAVYDNCLYVCDKVNNVYIFDGNKLKQYIDRSESYGIRKKVAFGISDMDYFVKSGSVWHKAERNTASCLIHRPSWLALYQNDLVTLLLFLLVVLAGIILFIPIGKSKMGDA